MTGVQQVKGVGCLHHEFIRREWQLFVKKPQRFLLVKVEVLEQGGYISEIVVEF